MGKFKKEIKNFAKRFNIKSKKKGVVAFEYMIILVFMVAVIIVAWNKLSPAIISRTTKVSNTVQNFTVDANGNVADPGEANGEG
jgi:Flp pilus assembly pilin Flp